jgi:hypothetical protein
MMKRFFTYVFMLAILTSCRKNKLKEFDLDYSQQFTIPGTTAVLNLPFNVVTPETTTNTESEYSNQNTSSKLIDEVTLSRLSFDVKSPAGMNFDFLNSIEIYISSYGYDEVLVASKYNIPQNGSTHLDLDVVNVDLKDYLAASSYKLRVKTVTDKNVTSDMTVQANETFHIKAKLKNLFNK